MDNIFVQAIAENCFGIQASARQLRGERDHNFLLTTGAGEQFVLKIANVSEERAVLEAQNVMLNHLASRLSFCPQVVPAISGEGIVTVEGRLVRMLTYVPGELLGDVESQSPELLYDVGRKLGQLSTALAGFDHPAAHRDFYWDLANSTRIIDEFGTQVKTDWLRELILGYRRDPRLSVDKLRKSVIHGDANDYNLLVDVPRNEVVGLIDFGDIVYSYTVGELAIAVAYVALGKDDPLAAGAPVIAGYCEQFPLTKEERDAVWPLAQLRLCMSVCIAAHQQAQQPENEYLGISQKLLAETLPRLLATDSPK